MRYKIELLIILFTITNIINCYDFALDFPSQDKLVLTNPENEKEFCSSDEITLEWNQITDSKGYEIYINDEIAGQSKINSYTLEKELRYSHEKYTWYVKSIDKYANKTSENK